MKKYHNQKHHILQSSLNVIAISLWLLILSGCNPKIVHFTNSKSAFKNYASYSILNLKKGNAELSLEGEVLLNTITDAIRTEMNRRDYAETSKPDIVVRYSLSANQVSSSRNSNMFNPYSMGVPINSLEEQSVLLIEIIDASTKKIVWQASMDMPKYSRRNPQKEVAREAVTKLFDTYLFRANSAQEDDSLKSK